jgi:hypothetical protein
LGWNYRHREAEEVVKKELCSVKGAPEPFE